MYAWASPEYMLDHMSLDQILMYYDYGIEQEELKSNILVGRLAVGLFGAKENPEKTAKARRVESDQTPDRAGFYKRHGGRIKRPGGGES